MGADPAEQSRRFVHTSMCWRLSGKVCHFTRFKAFCILVIASLAANEYLADYSPLSVMRFISEHGTRHEGIRPSFWGNSSLVEHKHVFFLKTHKAASTTVMNVLLRFALKRELDVMLPKKKNILSENSKSWRKAAMRLPPRRPHFDILCNHLVFDERSVRESLDPDVKFIGIVREPLSQAVSAFNYYLSAGFHVPYLKRIPGKYPLMTYMQNPQRWDHRDPSKSFTHNRMSFDFGMGRAGLKGDPWEIRRYLRYLNSTFHLVMVSDRFDESMVLLKRLLGWRLEDILYIKNNALKARVPRGYNFSLEDKRRHRLFNAADYALYQFFSKQLQRKVDAQDDTFADEVSTYRDLLKQTSEFCVANASLSDLVVERTFFSDTFRVSIEDCELMTMKEIPLVDIKRRQQLDKYKTDSIRNRTSNAHSGKT